jgi:hypothetical protein
MTLAGTIHSLNLFRRSQSFGHFARPIVSVANMKQYHMLAVQVMHVVFAMATVQWAFGPVDLSSGTCRQSCNRAVRPGL